MPSSNWNLRRETSASTTDVSGLDSTRFDPINHRLEESNNEPTRKPFLLSFSCPSCSTPARLTNKQGPTVTRTSFPARSNPAVAVIEASTDERRKILIRRRGVASRNLWRVPLFTEERDFLLLLLLFLLLFFWAFLVRWTLNGKRKRFSFVKSCSCKFFLLREKTK